MELNRLRVQDVDLEPRQITVRQGAGGRDRLTTLLLEGGSDIRTVQDLLVHKHVATTQIYTHVMQKPGLGVRSPLNAI